MGAVAEGKRSFGGRATTVGTDHTEGATENPSNVVNSIEVLLGQLSKKSPEFRLQMMRGLNGDGEAKEKLYSGCRKDNMMMQHAQLRGKARLLKPAMQETLRRSSLTFAENPGQERQGSVSGDEGSRRTSLALQEKKREKAEFLLKDKTGGNPLLDLPTDDPEAHALFQALQMEEWMYRKESSRQGMSPGDAHIARPPQSGWCI